MTLHMNFVMTLCAVLLAIIVGVKTGSWVVYASALTFTLLFGLYGEAGARSATQVAV